MLRASGVLRIAYHIDMSLKVVKGVVKGLVGWVGGWGGKFVAS